jgi:hypothetical protein
MIAESAKEVEQLSIRESVPKTAQPYALGAAAAASELHKILQNDQEVAVENGRLWE